MGFWDRAWPAFDQLIELDADDAVLLYNFQMPHFAHPWFLMLFSGPDAHQALWRGRRAGARCIRFPGTTLMRDLPLGVREGSTLW